MLNKLVSFFLLDNAKTNRPSYTITMIVAGFFIINIKLLLSGVQISPTIKFSDFTGVDYSAALGALGGIHIFNKKINNNNTTNPKQENE